jgi:hypothetical protein
MKTKLTALMAISGTILLTGMTMGGELSPETLLPVHAERDAYKPCVAFAKDTYLVAWQSGRLAPGDLREGLNFNGDIVGCRVGKDGKSLGATPFVICEAADLQEQPQAASNGDVFLVVWQDLRNGKDWDVYASRVTTDGKVLDKDGFMVSGGAHNQALPRVVWDGKTFVVVWQDFRSNRFYEVFGARVDTDGKVLDPQGFAVSSADGISFAQEKDAHRFMPAAASAGGGRSYVYWVGRSMGTWGHGHSGGDMVVDGKASWAYRFTPGDNLAGEREALKTGPVGKVSPLSLAAGNEGKVYLAAWQNHIPYSRGKGPSQCNAALYDEAGKRTKTLNVLGGDGFVIAPEVCWDGSAFVAAWDQVQSASRPQTGRFNAAYVSRISPEGAVTMAPQLLAGSLTSPAHEAAVASDGAGTTMIAYEKHPEKADVPIKIGVRVLTSK